MPSQQPDGSDKTEAIRSEPGVLVARSVLHRSLRQAEAAADELHVRIGNVARQRDGLVRQIGHMQEMLDRMATEHDVLTLHVRLLSSAAAPAE